MEKFFHAPFFQKEKPEKNFTHARGVGPPQKGPKLFPYFFKKKKNKGPQWTKKTLNLAKGWPPKPMKILKKKAVLPVDICFISSSRILAPSQNLWNPPQKIKKWAKKTFGGVYPRLKKNLNPPPHSPLNFMFFLIYCRPQN